MKLIRSLKQNLPELYLIISVLYFWKTSGVFVNPIAVGLFVITVFQFIFRNRLAGIIIAVAFLIFNGHLTYTLFNEYLILKSIGLDTGGFVLRNVVYIVLNLTMSLLMLFRYANPQDFIRYRARYA